MKDEKEVKCIIWDLDDTLWNGILLESSNVSLKPGIENIIKTLDSRGILHSIASKNTYDDAMEVLKRFKLSEYFLYPQINWSAKSKSVETIQKSLNIGFDTILFIDDQPFERDEVKNSHPAVTCIDAYGYPDLLSDDRCNPRFITEDSKRRRQMYFEDIHRNREEESFQGPKEEFMASLNMQFIISQAAEEDLKRAEELTVRTNQLNATGKTYDYDELNAYRKSDKHKLYICELKDKYGSYGKIGLALVEILETHLYIKLLLMSCRVMSRGVGSVLLSYIMQLAKEHGKKLLADFRETGRNRMMYVTYRFANFMEKAKDDNGMILFENDLSLIQPYPSYIDIKILN